VESVSMCLRVVENSLDNGKRWIKENDVDNKKKNTNIGKGLAKREKKEVEFRVGFHKTS